MTDEEHHQFTASGEQWERLKPAARAMRHEPTRAENFLWQQLRGRQINTAKFRRQHAIEGFVVDFVCVEHRLIIEIDGSIHDEPDQHALDQQRQALLEERGFRVLRFTNAQVLDSIEVVVKAIRDALTSPQTPLHERGA